MSLTVVQSPPAVSLVKNPIIYKLHTDNLYTTAGNYAALTLKLTDVIANDQTFTLIFGTNTLTFTCKTTPNNTGLQFAPKATAVLQGEELSACLQSNYIISTNYSINAFSDQDNYYYITLYSRVQSPSYTLSFTLNTCTYLTLSQNEAAVAPILNNLFKIFVQVVIYNELRHEISIEPNASGDITVDLQDYILPFTTSIFTWPQANDTLLKSVFPYYRYQCWINAAEYYGTPPSVQKLTTLPAFQVLHGGISTEKYNQFVVDNTNWLADATNKRLFLTNQPNTKYVRTSQPEYLYFILYTADVETINLKCLITYSDNTEETFTAATIGGMGQYGVVEICTNYTLLGLGVKAAQANKAITQYRVWVEDTADNRLSEIFRYYIDTTPELFDKYLIFKNSLGTYDSYRTTGISSKKVKVKSTTTKQYVDVANLTAFTRSKKQSNKIADAALKLNSGWIKDKLSVDYITNELLMSEDVYIVLNNKIYPVILNTEESLIYTDDVNGYYFEFELEFSFTDTSYSITPDLVSEITQAGGSFNRSFNDSFTNQQ